MKNGWRLPGLFPTIFYIFVLVRGKQDDHRKEGDKYDSSSEWFERWECHFRFGVVFSF